MNIDVPGTGIAFTIPVSSIGGKRALQFLTEDQDFQIGGETTLKDTKYELLIVIANQGIQRPDYGCGPQRKRGRRNRHPRQGYRDGTCRAVFGRFSRCRKEMVLIVIKREDKNRIMRAIMDQAGTASKARSVILSLPSPPPPACACWKTKSRKQGLRNKQSLL